MIFGVPIHEIDIPCSKPSTYRLLPISLRYERLSVFIFIVGGK